MAFAVTLGLPSETGQEVPQETIIALHGGRLRFGLGVDGRGNHVFIRLPIVAHHSLESIALDDLP